MTDEGIVRDQVAMVRTHMEPQVTEEEFRDGQILGRFQIQSITLANV